MSATERAAKSDGFFTASFAASDPEIYDPVRRELARQRDEIELIASENIVSRAVLEAQGSVLTNKYAEGYPGRRYYGGCQYVDVVETIAIERVTKLFDCAFANVQPHSGAQANQAAFMAVMRPGDTFHRPQSRSGRTSDARLASQHVRQVVQGGALRGTARRQPHRFRRGGASSRASIGPS